jgi:hypothetical protein
LNPFVAEGGGVDLIGLVVGGIPGDDLVRWMIAIVFDVCLCVLFAVLVFFVLLFRFWFEYIVALAGGPAGAANAVIGRFEDDLRGSEGYAGGFVAGANHLIWVEIGDFAGEPHGDLESVEHEPGAAEIDRGRRDGGEDLSESDLNAAVVFDGEENGIVCGRGAAKAAELDVVVAECLSLKGRRMAFASAGHDVPTFVIHSWLSGGVHPYSAGKFLVFNGLSEWVALRSYV